MKKTDWIFIASLAAYWLLFWQQACGLNFLIMTVILIGGLLVRDKTLLRNRAWVVSAVAALFTGFCVFWHDYAVCVLANFASLLLASSFVVNSKNSWFGAVGLGILNTITACAFIIIRFIQRMNNIGGNPEKPKRRLKRVVLVVFVVIIVAIFFSLYRGSNVLFASLTDKIDLSFISIGWCIFMGLGTILLFSFFRQQVFDPFTSWDRNHVKQLQLSERNGFLDKIMTLDSEYFSGIVLFGLLNAMLLLVNVLDIAFLAGGSGFLPSDVTYSEYVHQGTSQLILSIAFASALILFWFRNYHSEGTQYRYMKWLALFWVLQNIVMVAITVHRNHSYIYVFGLTYLRIGVDVFLLLASSGLFIVLWKIMKQRSNAFVFHNFGWACFAVLILAAPVNWDSMIVKYNASLNRQLDLDYIYSLSDYVLPQQHDCLKQVQHEKDFQVNYLHRKTFRFLSDQRYMREENMWQSITLAGNSAYADLIVRNDLAGKTVDASSARLNGLYFFPCYANITGLKAGGNYLDSIGEVGRYKKLEWLDLRHNGNIRSIEGIQSLQSLQILDIRETNVHDYSPVKKMPNLRELYVNSISSDDAEMFLESNPNLVIKTY